MLGERPQKFILYHDFVRRHYNPCYFYQSQFRFGCMLLILRPKIHVVAHVQWRLNLCTTSEWITSTVYFTSQNAN